MSCHWNRGAVLLSVLVWGAIAAGEPGRAAGAGAPASPPPAATTPVMITVQPGPRQTFRGLGVSQNNFMHPYNHLSPERQQRLSHVLFQDLNLKVLRLWFSLREYSPKRGQVNPEPFEATYVSSRIIADARTHGVTTLLLGPSDPPPYMLENPDKPDSLVKQSELVPYAKLLAGFIRSLRDRDGVRINVTGIANEPPWFTPATMTGEVKALRVALNQDGLGSVSIVAPENANNDDFTDRYLRALKADPAAWKALLGIATHSYNMASRSQEAAIVASTGKQFWITEAGGGPALPTSEAPGDARQAASMAARLLNDMNHGVTTWVWFLGAEDVRGWPESFDNVQRLIEYQWERPADWYLPLLKYYYLRRLSRTFDVGATFRSSVSSLEGQMTWTYGKKPRLTAAAARNPDGTWSLGLCDYTADDFLSDTPFTRENSGSPAEAFTVNIRVPELASKGAIRFDLHRSSQTLHNIDEGPVVMRRGEMKVEIAPLQLLTLRSESEPAPAGQRSVAGAGRRLRSSSH